MRICSAEQEKDRIDRMTSWHRRFAWFPTRLDSGDTVWLEVVERRLEGGEAKWDFDGFICIWEYRKIPA